MLGLGEVPQYGFLFSVEVRPEPENGICCEVGLFPVDKAPQGGGVHAAFLSKAIERYATLYQTCDDVISEVLFFHAGIMTNVIF